MSRTEKLLEFTLSGLHCALRLSDSERILHASEITPVPNATMIVMGLINVQGRIIPILYIRRLLSLPEIEMTLNDQIILSRTTSFSAAIPHLKVGSWIL